MAAFEPHTVRFVERTTDADTTFIDLGAWMGPVSAVAAQIARRVIAVEPDPVAARELKEMAGGLPPIEVWQAAISADKTPLQLYAGTLGETVTSALGSRDGEIVIADAVTFDDLRKAVPDGKVVLKVDIEGHEYAIAQSLAAFAKAYAAPVNLSIHPAILYRSLRPSLGFVRSRIQVWRQTAALLATMRDAGHITVTKTGAEIGALRLLSFMFLRKRPKNFQIDVMPYRRALRALKVSE